MFSQQAAIHNWDLAIIGMACRFPGANNYNQFWVNLEKGTNSITEVPSDRWNIDQFYSPNPEDPNKTISRWGGFIEDADKFDAQFFGISPREAKRLDPQQRLLMELTWSCLEDAGYSPPNLSGSNIGVFLGVCNFEYKELLEKYDSESEGQILTGNYGCFLSNRLSFWFNFYGPSVSIDTACSSSLVAIHQAIAALNARECEMALVAGVSVLCTPTNYIATSKLGMLSPEGKCKTFDAKADGYVRGEGAGVILLKPLTKAIEDRDRIYGVIKGSSVNHGGHARNLTSPNAYAQSKVIRAAYTKAAIPPDTIAYIEAHGTGTALGDPIEISGLKRAFTQLYQQYGIKPTGSADCGLGSVKTNIGHLESAAGIAGVIKVLLAMKHKTLPKTNNLQVLNPRINLAGSPFYLVEETKYWQPLKTKEGKILPRRAGVSSFGFGGANAHVVLEEAPEISLQPNRIDRPLHLLALSAKSEKALRELAKRYEDFFLSNPERSPADVCFTANWGRAHFEHRLALVAESTVQLQGALGSFAAGKLAPGLVSAHSTGSERPKLAFLFTGQGAQYAGMGHQLYETQPTFRQILDRCDRILRLDLKKSLLEVLYPTEPDSPIDETAYTQPALFAIEYALAELWKSWGIEPTAVIGHSIGEYVAACIAGVFSLEDGLKLMQARGQLMQALPQNGDMVAVLADESQVRAAIGPYNNVVIAAFNGPQNIVISGERQAIGSAIATLEAQGIETRKLKVSHAFHSPMMEPMLAAFKRVASEVTFSSPQIDLISNITGKLATSELATPDYWCNHIRQPVRFATSMETLYRNGYEIFVEIGPKPILLGMGRQCLPDNGTHSGTPLQWLPSLRSGISCWQQLLQSLGELHVRGVPVDWSGFERDYQRQRLELPTYPFQRQRYWIDTETPLTVLPEKPTQTGLVKLLDEGDTEQLVRQLKKGENFSEDEAKLLPKLLEVLVKQHQDEQLEVGRQEKAERPSCRETTKLLPEHQQPKILSRLEACSSKERLALLVAHIQSEVATVMGLEPSGAPSPQVGFFDMGLDSMMVVELKNRLKNSLGLSLSPNVAFNYPTIKALAGYLDREIFAFKSSGKSDNSLHDEVLAVTAAKLEKISEAEMEKLLLEKLQSI